jgi:NAD(P)-dependent dehydrogenase (short-subunit alcohol dehydrogenase family)
MPTAIVTGASRGLGLALARALHDRGWRLVLDARDGAALAAATAGLDRATRVEGDVTDARHRRALVDAAAAGIDLLVHNASELGAPLAPLADLPLATFERVHRVNVSGPVALTRLALPRIAAGGRILFVSSDAAIEAYPTWGAYGASKAALDHVAATLAGERPELRVYAVDPGDMNTRMHQDAFPGEDISDRPPPEASVPGLLVLAEGSLPSGRYCARKLAPDRAPA